MKATSKTMSFLLIVLVFVISGCRANISRNADGSLTVETTISQQELQEAITASIADPLIKSIIGIKPLPAGWSSLGKRSPAAASNL